MHEAHNYFVSISVKRVVIIFFIESSTCNNYSFLELVAIDPICLKVVKIKNNEDTDFL